MKIILEIDTILPKKEFEGLLFWKQLFESTVFSLNTVRVKNIQIIED